MARTRPVERLHTHAATTRALQTWAAQKRSVFVGLEGYRPYSIITQIGRERCAADKDWLRRQRWPEVYHGDGEIVQRVVSTLQDVPRMTLTCYYTLAGPWSMSVRAQATAIGITTTAYWINLRIAEAVVDSGIKLLASLPGATTRRPESGK
jgi:hypothetical protein